VGREGRRSGHNLGICLGRISHRSQPVSGSAGEHEPVTNLLADPGCTVFTKKAFYNFTAASCQACVSSTTASTSRHDVVPTTEKRTGIPGSPQRPGGAGSP
ncbi:MAG: hypothetical protein ACK55Z_31435, partial [bacterium]